MNASLLDSLMTNFSYVLLVFIIALFIGFIILLMSLNAKNRSDKKKLNMLNVLDNAFSLAPYPAVIINHTGHVINANKKAAKLFDMSESELKDTFLDAYTIISNSNRLTNTMQEEIKKSGSYQFRNEIKIHGERIFCDFNIIPLSMSNKTEYLVIIEPKPDESRREFEQNLLAARLDEVENAAGIGYWVYDYDKNETIWSRGLYKLLAKKLNTTKPDLSFLSQFSPDSQESIQNLLLAIKNQQPYYDRVVLRGDDGILRTVDLYLKHQEGLNVDVQRSMGILREVREFSVGENETLYANLWTHVTNIQDVLIILIDNNGIVKFINKYALSILDIDLEDIIEKNIEDYVDSNEENSFKSFNRDYDQYLTTRINDSLIYWQTMADSVENRQFTFLAGIDLTDCKRKYTNSE